MEKTKMLIIHGWMHSSDRYEILKKDLEEKLDCSVDLYEMPGFGKTKGTGYRSLLEKYSHQVRSLICSNEYDYVIGHSMGGNIALRAMDSSQTNAKLILLSPAYKGIPHLKLITPFLSCLLVLLLMGRKIRCRLVDSIIKVCSLPTVNSYRKIDARIVSDVRNANPMVAVLSLIELIWDDWTVTKGIWDNREVDAIVGSNDRVILRKNINILLSDIPNCSIHEINGIGHTAIVESYQELLCIISSIIRRSKHAV